MDLLRLTLACLAGSALGFAPAFAPVLCTRIQKLEYTAAAARGGKPLYSLEMETTTTELPDSFDAGVAEAVESTLAAAGDGWTKLRLDWDTTAGDATYTVLKNTIPVAQKYLSGIAQPLLDMAAADAAANAAAAEAEAAGAGAGAERGEAAPGGDEPLAAASSGGKPAEGEERTMRLYFPDAGSAALAARDWKVGQPGALVPSCVRLASLSRDLPAKSDFCVVFLCPRASEVDALRPVLAKLDAFAEEAGGQEVTTIFMNPELINMGVTGFGLAGRMLRETVLDVLVQAYYIRTLEWGAIVRAYPKGYTVHQVAPEAEGGYALVQTTARLPDADELGDLAEALYTEPGQEAKGPGFFTQFGKFVEGFGRI